MADFSKRGPGCDDCDGEGGERGERGKRGKRGPRGRDGSDGRNGGPIVTDPTPPTLTGDGTEANPLQVINVAVQPYVFPNETKIIYVRASGSDETGDGTTPETAYRTVKRATLDIPRFTPEGVEFVIDASGLIEGGPEILPPNYTLPVWVTSNASTSANQADPFFSSRGVVTLRADLRDVPSLGADAIITDADLEFPTVGDGIVTASNMTPIVIETTNPHGLVESPFGLQFGVDEGFVQVVFIDGVVGNDVANGVFFALVTSPTTFELYDFDLMPVAGDGAGAGGTVTVFFVKDPRSGQFQIRLSSSRESWVPGSLRGKLLVEPESGSKDNFTIYDNTEDTLSVVGLFPPSFGSPVRIMEQTCVLQCSDSAVEGGGGLIVVNQDALLFAGIEVRAAPDGSGLVQIGGGFVPLACRLENPVFDGGLRTIDSYLIRPVCFGGSILQNRSLIEAQEGFSVDSWIVGGGTVFLEQESPLGNRDSGIIDWIGVKVIATSADPVFLIKSGDTFLTSISIEGGAGDAVVVEGQGRHRLFGVGGSGWSGFALVVDNGAQVEVDRFTFSDTDEMVVGSLPPRTFLDFRTNFPQRNQFDIPPNSNIEDATGSRVFQREP